MKGSRVECSVQNNTRAQPLCKKSHMKHCFCSFRLSESFSLLHRNYCSLVPIKMFKVWGIFLVSNPGCACAFSLISTLTLIHIPKTSHPPAPPEPPHPIIPRLSSELFRLSARLSLCFSAPWAGKLASKGHCCEQGPVTQLGPSALSFTPRRGKREREKKNGEE